MDEIDWLGADNQIGIDIWNKKYRHNDETFEDWLQRVSGCNKSVAEQIRSKKFLFGGRILANRGIASDGIKSTLSNCYVLEPPKDSIESIFECASKLARTSSYGGGVGIDLSQLSPRGSKINNTALETSGSVSFTDLYSMVTGLIGQHGRRGALMLSLSCEHPDLEEFMLAKTDVERDTKANMSIRYTDEFMQAVVDGKQYEQRFYRPETDCSVKKSIDASAFFDEMCRANWDYGEPGCLFWDTISNWNLVSDYPDFSYAGTNPCAEEPLPAGGSCLLGSINLHAFVKNKKFDFSSLEDTVRIAVRALNDVLDEGLPLHPLEEQRKAVKDWRQIGLGIMGLADALIELGIEYGSKESLSFSEQVSSRILDSAVSESAELAQEFGPFPKYNKESTHKSAFFRSSISRGTRNKVMGGKGLRNSQLLTIAPTGSISTMIGVSGGIEPLFATHYNRKTISLHNHEEDYTIYPPIVARYMRENGLKDDAELPEYFATAHTIPYHARIDMQACWQRYIDASISSTINLPSSATVEEVRDLYITAWQSNCKGVTIFRDGCKRGGILTAPANKPEERGQIEDVEDNVIGKKRKLMTGCGSLHCTAFFSPTTGALKEVYLSKGSTGGCNNFMVGLSRMISLSARSGCDVQDIVDQLKSCGSCPSYAVRSATKKDTSKGSCCPMAVGNALIEMHNEMLSELGIENKSPKTPSKIINPCPVCGAELNFEGGCNICKSCGWTKCD